MTTLRQGSQGDPVRRLQLLLNSTLRLNPALPPDGQFGPRTQAAVVLFQQKNGLVADGIVGPRTWEALGQRPVPLSVETPPPSDAPWLEVAAAELGIQENGAPGQHTKRILEYHATTTLQAQTDEVPWCSSFVNWAVRQAGHAGTDNALAGSWLNWGKPLTPPAPGAVTVIKRKNATSDTATGSSTGFHVGFFISQTSSTIRLLGGNQSNMVRYSNFLLSSYDVRGHRWPA